MEVRKDGSLVHVELRGTPFIYKGQPHFLAVMRDVTEQVQTEQALREREQQYRNIFEATSDGLNLNDPETGLVVEANHAMYTMHGYTHDEFIGLHPTTFIHPDYHHLFREYLETVKAGGTFQAQAIDIRKDGTPFHVEVHGSGFMYKGKLHVLGVVRDITERVQAYQLLEQRVQERTRELSTLLEVSHNVASTLELKPLLDLILSQLKALVDYDGAAVHLLEGKALTVIGYYGPIPQEHALGSRFPIGPTEASWEAISKGQPTIIDDVRGDTLLARAFQRSAERFLNHPLDYVRSWMGVPLIVKERVIGMVTLDHGEPGHYTLEHARLATAVANQAAIAIENARLYEQAQQLAALEERQKLARELHDSVSQALYGIGLGARTARTLLDRDPRRAAEPLDYVLSLAEAGLAEMRALIFELRPESLETEGLVAALNKQASSLRARHHLVVETAFCEEPEAALEVKQVLYRIAQEALHNTVKHARASRVTLRLERSGDRLVLVIADNGVGFDPQREFPGHLGLRSMRERAERLGGVFVVDSAPDQGTRLQAEIPL